MDFIKVKRKRRTAQDWYDLVKQWLGSGKSQREFCEQARFQADSLGAIKNELQAAVTKFNTYRPHCALDGLTLMEYITQLCQQEAVWSHRILLEITHEYYKACC